LEISFDPRDHRYALDGQAAPSVTHVLEAEGFSGSRFWKEEDRQRGTAVHKVAHLLGGTPWEGGNPEEIVRNSRWDPAGTHSKIIPYGFSLAAFYLETGFRPQYTEQMVGSHLLRVCGTFDQWGVMDEQNTLVDYKSGEPQEAAHVQTALYDFCAEETLGLKTARRLVVWLKPDKRYQIVLPKLDPAIYMNAGKSAVNCYHWRERFRML
jgi:hypothetical protein